MPHVGDRKQSPPLGLRIACRHGCGQLGTLKKRDSMESRNIELRCVELGASKSAIHQYANILFAVLKLYKGCSGIGAQLEPRVSDTFNHSKVGVLAASS